MFRTTMMVRGGPASFPASSIAPPANGMAANHRSDRGWRRASDRSGKALGISSTATSEMKIGGHLDPLTGPLSILSAAMKPDCGSPRSAHQAQCASCLLLLSLKAFLLAAEMSGRRALPPRKRA